MKKQIVFIEYFPSIHTLKMAKGLKDSGKYETVLIAFNKFDKRFYERGFNKIINLEVSQRPSLKNLLFLTKKMLSKERAKFFLEIKALNPYIVQIIGLGLFSFLISFLMKKKVPKAYYAYDIIAFYDKKTNEKWSIRKYNLSYFPMLLKRLEKYYFKNMDGILHKGPREELALLDFPVNIPDLAILPGCLEDWTHTPKKKNMKEIHIAVAGPPLEAIYLSYPFKNIIKEITAQKIHLHTYGKSCLNDNYFLNEEKNNSYFHYHDKVNPKELNERISKYHYGMIPDFFNDLVDPLWPKNSTGNKMYNFLEAGLPIIISNDLQVMVDIVTKYKVGIGVDYKDLKNLKKILTKLNYKRLQQNVKIAQKELSIGKITKELESFYERVIEKKARNNKHGED